MSLFKTMWRTFLLLRKGRGVRGTAQLLATAPKQIALVGRLLGDTRVPPVAKALFVGAGVFAVSPLNVPGWIPGVGLLDDMGIGLLAVNVFLKLIPSDVLSEHRQDLGLEPKPIRVTSGRR